MSVMCCRIPEFLIGLAKRAAPDLAGKPVALLGADERVWAASPAARQGGVRLQMLARQARLRCPDVQLQPLDLGTCRAEQDAFTGTLAACGLPVESPAWGMAYVDLHALGGSMASRTVQPYCADLGKQVREALGDALAPSIGWDTGKFTARAAATASTPGHMRLVDHSHEERFLSPLSIDLLPLNPLALQQLDWLGIRTLGQFARLPTTAVWQRFGAEGKLAQQWTRGRDDRPVHPTAFVTSAPLAIDFDPPVALHAPVLDAIMHALSPTLDRLARRLEGLNHLRLTLTFDAPSQKARANTRVIDCTFIEPVSDARRIRATLGHQLEILNWPAELGGVQIALLASGELIPRQLELFGHGRSRNNTGKNKPRVPRDSVASLRVRYGNIFFQPRIADPRHPLPERRAVWEMLGAGA